MEIIDIAARTPRAVLQWLWDEFQWPPWASTCCICLSICLLLLHGVARVIRRTPPSSSSSSASSTPCSGNGVPASAHGESAEYQRFRRQYLIVYFLVMFADWLQGTHMYSLYESYGVNISVLFLTGFLASAVLGNAVGPIVDKYGRRNACLVFCVLEIAINLMENFPRMPVLLVGRVLGGISTSLLFSAFESWMVTEHRARGFDEEWIAKTFAMASEGNGLLAVLAGVAAQFTADAVGEIGPFRLAVVVTVVAMACILPWNENFGSTSPSATITEPSTKDKTAAKRWSVQVYAVGMCYSLFDGAMYVFVFLWYPTLHAVVPNALLPSGLVFSSFMICIAIGGKLYDMAGGNLIQEENLAILLCSVAAGVLLIPMVTQTFEFILLSFLIFEMCVGAFSPCSGTLRSRYFPTERLSTILGTFRLPTNVLVVLGTGGSNYVAREELFLICSLVMLIAAVSGAMLVINSPKTESSSTSRPKRE